MQTICLGLCQSLDYMQLLCAQARGHGVIFFPFWIKWSENSFALVRCVCASQYYRIGIRKRKMSFGCWGTTSDKYCSRIHGMLCSQTTREEERESEKPVAPVPPTFRSQSILIFLGYMTCMICLLLSGPNAVGAAAAIVKRYVCVRMLAAPVKLPAVQFHGKSRTNGHAVSS